VKVRRDNLLLEVEQSSQLMSRSDGRKKKSQLGQFFTPVKIAEFMAGLFTKGSMDKCRLLDAGAGMGSLSVAFLERWASGGFDFKCVEIDAFEIDEDLHPHLSKILKKYMEYLNVLPTVLKTDFISTAVESLNRNLFSETLSKYTHAILNPPYKKINNNSLHRFALRQVGIETVNMYSAFVALALSLLEEHGQLVAITPRSFCNGPYYRPFREYILKHAAIRQMHLFASRDKAFKEDAVLQENLIIVLERGAEQGNVTVTTSADESFSDLKTYNYPFDSIVLSDDSECFIHVPTSPDYFGIDNSDSIRYTLEDIGLKVSTGPVVDFRLKEYLRDMPEPGCVPLLYPAHFSSGTIEWPKPDMKKPNAIQRNMDTEKWFYPNGFYCVVRRLSSKEERRRIVANLVDPTTFGDTKVLGFENHLNVFHENKSGLPQALAIGLSLYLSTTVVDKNFRRFSGHTQVNATDLKLIRYPSRETLIEFGKWGMKRSQLTQETIDEKFGILTS